MIQVRDVRFYRLDLKTRFPFRYGIASMNEVPYLIVVVDLNVDGKCSTGMSADLLPPKWFTKDPESDFEQEDLPAMLRVIRHAAKIALDLPPTKSLFQWWRELYATQNKWSAKEQLAPLLTGFGVSLIERAVIDAFCRARNLSVHRLLRDNIAEINFATIRPELSGITPGDVVVPALPDALHLRHTIGMGDPLTDSEITEEDRVDDGLPHSLTASIRANGLKYFKIKLAGDLQRDRDRLVSICRVLDQELAGEFQFTVDGNENFRSIGEFRDQFDQHLQTPELQEFLERGLLFVEQPLHRDVALDESVCTELNSWSSAPPMIIDESDAELSSLPTALELGYAGTSHKNCKGVFKGLLNAASIWKEQQADKQAILSGEDLANLGPIALLQDLVVAASLGVKHVERNGHHYFAGLSQFPENIQEQVLQHHSDLYHKSPNGFAALAPQDGRLLIRSLATSPFGYCEPPDLSEFTSVSVRDE